MADREATGIPGSPSATTSLDGKQLPLPPPKFGGVIKENAKASTPWWAPQVVPPKDAPNILLIMTDDQGYGVSSAFGGIIPTPRGVGAHIDQDLFGRELKPGQHTIVFDFKYDGPGPGKGGTGVLSVDGRELAKKTINHTIPMIMALDETFDVGLDTRTGVDSSYELPFKFTGTIDKLTFKLGASQISEVEKKTAAEALAMAHD